MTVKRLYISADIEGVAGVVSREQLTPGGFEYQQAREWMTGEVVAACQAAFDCGIKEVVVSDSHGNGQNLLLDQLPDRVQVVRSWPRPLCMMEGVQQGEYIAAMLLGYHSGATQKQGVLAHTLHGRGISELRLNGEVASETVISAATAAHFHVPVVMVSGDDAYIKHAKEVLGDIETSVTKWTCSFLSARTLLPKESRQCIADGVTAALSRVSEFQPKALRGPIEVDVRCVQRYSAELLDYLPMIERMDAYTVRFVGEDIVAVSRFLSFLLASGVLTAT